jgi:hypothetical protein
MLPIDSNDRERREAMYNNSMLLGFKTELDLNNQQRTALAKHAEVVARHA